MIYLTMTVNSGTLLNNLAFILHVQGWHFQIQKLGISENALAFPLTSLSESHLINFAK